MGMELPELQQDFARETTAHSTQLQLRSANLTSISSPSICLPPQRRQASIPAGHPKAIMGAAGAGKGGIWGAQVLTSPEHHELPAVPAAAELSFPPPPRGRNLPTIWAAFPHNGKQALHHKGLCCPIGQAQGSVHGLNLSDS